MLKTCTNVTIASLALVCGDILPQRRMPLNLLKSLLKNLVLQRNRKTLKKQLIEKHKRAYSLEQLRAWSHMIRLKTHNSLDRAPDKPFFRGYKRCNADDSQSPSGKVPESKRHAVSTAISPGKKLNMRSESINQL